MNIGAGRVVVMDYKVLDEVGESEPFRQVSCVFGENDYSGLERGMNAVRSLVCKVGTANYAAGEEAQRLLALDNASLLDILARKVLALTRERLAYLAANDANDRVAMVQEALAELVLQECAISGVC